MLRYWCGEVGQGVLAVVVAMARGGGGGGGACPSSVLLTVFHAKNIISV